MEKKSRPHMGREITPPPQAVADRTVLQNFFRHFELIVAVRRALIEFGACWWLRFAARNQKNEPSAGATTIVSVKFAGA
jgi:hypothetical protein